MKSGINKAMTESKNLEAAIIDVHDSQGNLVCAVDKAFAAHLVNSGAYYLETTADIVLKSRRVA